MNNSAPDDCFVCRKHRGEVDVPGGVIYEINLIYISHAQLWGDEKEHYLGHVFVEPKRHVAEIADLTDKEAEIIGVYTSRIANALLRTENMEHIYIFVFGDGVPHVHYHVIGRYPGAPSEYWGTKVDEWPEAPKEMNRQSHRWQGASVHFSGKTILLSDDEIKTLYAASSPPGKVTSAYYGRGVLYNQAMTEFVFGNNCFKVQE